MLAKTVDDSVQQLFSKMDLDMLEALGRVYVIILLVMLAYSAASYVLHAMGLHTIAKRRGVRTSVACVGSGGTLVSVGQHFGSVYTCPKIPFSQQWKAFVVR